MNSSKYDKFKALDPFFNIVMKGLEGLVDGDHFWDAVADEAVFEFLYRFPGWPERLESRAAYMTAMEGYGMDLHSADGLAVHLTRDPQRGGSRVRSPWNSPIDRKALRQPLLFNCDHRRSQDCPLARLHGYPCSRAGNVDFMRSHRFAKAYMAYLLICIQPKTRKKISVTLTYETGGAVGWAVAPGLN